MILLQMSHYLRLFSREVPSGEVAGAGPVVRPEFLPIVAFSAVIIFHFIHNIL
jgi:hypothetical protein